MLVGLCLKFVQALHSSFRRRCLLSACPLFGRLIWIESLTIFRNISLLLAEVFKLMTVYSPHMFTPGATINQSPVPHRKIISSSSPVATMQSMSSSIWLSNNCRAQLEHLMMEGDMIEVALDETQLLWKILKACQPNASESSNLRTKVCWAQTSVKC